MTAFSCGFNRSLRPDDLIDRLWPRLFRNSFALQRVIETNTESSFLAHFIGVAGTKLLTRRLCAPSKTLTWSFETPCSNRGQTTFKLWRNSKNRGLSPITIIMSFQFAAVRSTVACLYDAERGRGRDDARNLEPGCCKDSSEVVRGSY